MYYIVAQPHRAQAPASSPARGGGGILSGFGGAVRPILAADEPTDDDDPLRVGHQGKTRAGFLPTDRLLAIYLLAPSSMSTPARVDPLVSERLLTRRLRKIVARTFHTAVSNPFELASQAARGGGAA